MKQTIQHEKYGEIIYQENPWTGKKSLTLGGVALEKISKKEFKLEDGSIVSINGSFLSGASLAIGGETIMLIPKIKWYEILLCIWPLVLTLTWGNIVALCRIVPIVGGALGGAIGGIFSMLGLCLIKSVKPIWLKIIIAVASLGITFGICCGIAYAMLA